MYRKDIYFVLKKYNTDIKKGKTFEEELKENVIVSKKSLSVFKMILIELKSFFNILLLVAAVLSLFVGENISDSIFIFIIIILNIFLSIFEQKKALKTMDSLKSLALPKARVIRDGKEQIIESSTIRLGDIVLLEAGDSVPCDLRLIETKDLKINESLLTGESTLINKDAFKKIVEKVSLNERVNMAYMGTTVILGRAKGIAVNIGMNTELGKIADMLNEIKEEKTPLKSKIDNLSKQLGIISVIVCLIVIFLGIFRGVDLMTMILIGISLAVSAIPEGLGTVITMVLAIGMRNMAKKNALVKTLSAVESLGQATVICTDKTGTLTLNKMEVVKIFDNNRILDAKRNKVKHPKLLDAFVLCNDAIITNNQFIGDPTELSLVSLAEKNDVNIEKLREFNPRVDEYVFDSKRKLMSTKHKIKDAYFIYTKGGLDEVLNKCSFYYKDNKELKMNDEFKKLINKKSDDLAKKSMRVLAFAYKKTKANLKIVEKDLVFLGFVAIKDPIREEVPKAIKECKKAKIKVIMITGDHEDTAFAIAKSLGLCKKKEEVIKGIDFESLSDKEAKKVLKKVKVFARTNPKDKLRIVDLLQSSGEVVAMTGDGVNDAPALKRADIGVAMGKVGSDVSKEAADMILLNDNFTTIIDAIREGRGIYSNIKKFVFYLISCNIGEVLLIFLALLLGFASPLFAVQILWINLLTDTLPAFSLGLEKKRNNLMNKKPINKSDKIVDKKVLKRIIVQSTFLAFSAILSYIIGSNINNDNLFNLTNYEVITTFVFVTIIVGELLRAYSAKDESKFLFKVNLFDNKFLNIASLISFSMLMLVIYISPINAFLHLAPLSLFEFLVAFLLGFIPLIGSEIAKKISLNF